MSWFDQKVQCLHTVRLQSPQPSWTGSAPIVCGNVCNNHRRIKIVWLRLLPKTWTNFGMCTSGSNVPNLYFRTFEQCKRNVLDILHSSRMRTARFSTISHSIPGSMYQGGYLPPGHNYPLDILSENTWYYRYPPPPRKGMGPEIPTPGQNDLTDACENITFPQLRWRVMNILIVPDSDWDLSMNVPANSRLLEWVFSNVNYIHHHDRLTG